MTTNMTHLIITIPININEAKAKLSKHTKMVEAGETVILCERNKPFAEIRPLDRRGSAARVFGLSKSVFRLGPEFFKADAEIQKIFGGD
jgi:antitoxin (DNA-binding transcriptional repressor) of toxin-antitoxin stability system